MVGSRIEIPHGADYVRNDASFFARGTQEHRLVQRWFGNSVEDGLVLDATCWYDFGVPPIGGVTAPRPWENRDARGYACARTQPSP